MIDRTDQSSDLRMIARFLRDFFIAAVVGVVAYYAAGYLIRDQMFAKYGQYDWWGDFLSFVTLLVAVTVGGLAYALILHIHSKRSQGK